MASTEIHEFESLLFDWEDGILDATGIARLRDLLRTSPEVRRLYVQRQMFGAIFKLDGDAGISSPDLEHSGATIANVSATDIEHFLPSTVLHDAVDAHAVVQGRKVLSNVDTGVFYSLLPRQFFFVFCWDAGCLSSRDCSPLSCSSLQRLRRCRRSKKLLQPELR